MKRILIVDDNEANLYMLEILLKGEGFEVILAANGKEAWEKALLAPPDLIVTDVLMPVMDGYALCKNWKSDDKLKHIPFVIYTATYTGTKNEAFALSLGADRFILKPQEPDMLLRLLSEVLADNYTARQVETKPLEEEIQFFRQYNEILFNKLEKKMSDLETANRELKVLAERYRLSFENVSDVIYMIDNDFKIISISPSVERIMGYKPEAFIGRNVADLADIFAAGSLERAVKDIDLILNGHPISSMMYEFIAKDGSVIFGEVSGSPIMQEGKILGMIAIARDVTDRQRAQEELRESERQYRELYDFLPIPAYEMDFNANITFANRAIYETFRGTEADLKKGFNAWRLLSDEEAEKSRRNIDRLLHGEQVKSTEYNFKRLDDSCFPALVTSSVLYRNDKPVGLRGAIIDITERKRVEDDLRKSEEKYRFLFNNASESILVIQGGTIRFANPASLILSGYPEEDLLFKPFTEFIHPEDREMVYGYYEKRTAGEEVPSNYTFRIKTRDGAVKWVSIHAALVDWEGGSATLNFLSDITEQKRATEALRESEEKYHSLFEHLQDAVFLTRPDGSIIEANKAACEMFGRSVDELRSLGRSAVVDEADPCLTAALEERVRTGRARAEITMLRANGEKFLGDITSTIFTDMNGQQKTSMIVRDITERKKAADALRNSEARFRSYFELPLIGIAITSPEKGWLEGNDRLTSILGYPWQELRNMTWVDLTHPEDLAADVEQFHRVLAGEIESYMIEKRFIRKSGEAIWTSMAAGCVRKKDGAVDYFVVLLEDITERKESVNRLRKSLGATIQAMAVTVEARDPYTAGHQHRVADLARSIAAELGLPADQIDGIGMAATIHDLGKISVPAELLSMPRKLTDIEFSLIKTHSRSGYDILKDIEFPWPIARIILEHHERMNGSGYPQGLRGDNILIESRIISVADVVESMASHRPYRASLGIDAALEEIGKYSGILYDDNVVDACLRLFRDKGFQLLTA